jgi:4-hydroxythreonine-4-phosphate dehydrogenase
LVVSTGCPSGVGPDVSLLAARALPRGARAVLLGDMGCLQERARAVGVDPSRLVRVATAAEGFSLERGLLGVVTPHRALSPRDRRAGAPSKAGGAAQLAYVDLGADWARDGLADALVTGPVSKAAVVRSGAPGSRGFAGHTEHLMRRLGAPSVTMAFWSSRFTTSLVTTHLALRQVSRAITRHEVLRATLHTARFLADLESGPVALAVAGLNPHAGEEGLLGGEEIAEIAPAVRAARRALGRDVTTARVSVAGPVPAETALRLAAEGAYAGVVAMFHDQATIAMKLTGFGEAVNVSLGLPIVRTSVDHGTAYDRAGTGAADARGMREAIGLAARMARARAEQ